jgi:branched-chain amino acid transport system ATP-binding protein
MLRTEHLTKSFESLTAVDDVSVEFGEDEVVAIIGPNGAGKTTFFNLLTGALSPTEGTISFKGEDITDHTPEQVANTGLVRSYQVTTVFEDLTVLENVQIAVQTRHNPYNLWRKAVDLPGVISDAEEILDDVGLLEKRDVTASQLSHGEHRTLDIAVALGTDPSMLLLDEPTSGMSTAETSDMIDLLSELSTSLPTIIVEHKMDVVNTLADRIMVLHQGSILADGTPTEVKQDEDVRQVYLTGSTTTTHA